MPDPDAWPRIMMECMGKPLGPNRKLEWAVIRSIGDLIHQYPDIIECLMFLVYN